MIDAADDGILAEYPSVLDAVRGAFAIQDGMADRNVSAPPERVMHCRIGLNQSDVIVDEKLASMVTASTSPQG